MTAIRVTGRAINCLPAHLILPPRRNHVATASASTLDTGTNVAKSRGERPASRPPKLPRRLSTTGLRHESGGGHVFTCTQQAGRQTNHGTGHSEEPDELPVPENRIRRPEQRQGLLIRRRTGGGVNVSQDRAKLLVGYGVLS